MSSKDEEIRKPGAATPGFQCFLQHICSSHRMMKYEITSPITATDIAAKMSSILSPPFKVTNAIKIVTWK